MNVLIERLHEARCSCVIAQGNEVRLFHQRGVADLYTLLTEEPHFLRGASVADRVVGKGAAALMLLGGVNRLHSDVISRPALQLLQQAGVEVTYGELTERIVNRAGTGWCPLETLCMEIDTPEEMWPLIDTFVKKQQEKRNIAL